jgi:hypothetical protein
LAGISTESFRGYDPRRYPDGHHIIGNILQHDSISADYCSITNVNWPYDLCPNPKFHIIPNSRSLRPAGTPASTDHDLSADKAPSTNMCLRVNDNCDPTMTAPRACTDLSRKWDTTVEE